MQYQVRTTVTLENDVERMLREEMHRSRRSFKQTLNAVLRIGLTGKVTEPKASPFVFKARRLGLRADIDATSFNRLTDVLEADAFQTELRRTGK